jgi:hypothetical protein
VPIDWIEGGLGLDRERRKWKVGGIFRTARREETSFLNQVQIVTNWPGAKNDTFDVRRLKRLGKLDGDFWGRRARERDYTGAKNRPPSKVGEICLWKGSFILFTIALDDCFSDVEYRARERGLLG